MASVRRRISGEDAKVGYGGVRPDVEVGQRQLPGAAALPVEGKRGGRQRSTGPRQGCAQRLVDVQQCIQRLDARPWDKQFGVDDEIDVQRRAFTADLQLLDGPFVPGACFVDAIHPDVGVDERAGAAVVVRQATCRHGER